MNFLGITADLIKVDKLNSVTCAFDVASYESTQLESEILGKASLSVIEANIKDNVFDLNKKYDHTLDSIVFSYKSFLDATLYLKNLEGGVSFPQEELAVAMLNLLQALEIDEIIISSESFRVHFDRIKTIPDNVVITFKTKPNKIFLYYTIVGTFVNVFVDLDFSNLEVYTLQC